MAYPSFLGEFIVDQNQDDWVKRIQYNERRPVAVKGLLNPWETEQKRAVWQKEQEAWAKIQPLQQEYRDIEKKMEQDISIFNSHLKELERITKKSVGLGPIGTYGGMALAVLPGFGWFSAAFSAISMVVEMLGGNKKKKRLNELMRIMEQAQIRLHQGQQRLQSIQQELIPLLQSTEVAKQQVALKQAVDTSAMQVALQQREAYQKLADQQFSDERKRIRQIAPKTVYYDSL